MSDLFPAAFLAMLERLPARLSRLRGRQSLGMSAKHGLRGGDDFAGHAQYHPGDDPRQIDWAAYGRLDRLFLKTFVEQREQRLLLVPDLSRSMDYGGVSKRDHGLRLAAALGWLALTKGATVSLALPTGAVEVRGKERFGVLLAACLAAGTLERGYWEWLAPQVAAAGSDCSVIVLSDCMEPVAAATALFRRPLKPGQLAIVAVLSREEQSPELAHATGALELVNSEGGDKLEVHADAEALAAYRAELDAHLTQWRTLLARHRVQMVATTSDDDLERVLLDDLAVAGVVA